MFYPSYDDYMRDIFYYNGLNSGGVGYGNPMNIVNQANGGAMYIPSQMNSNYNMQNNANLNNLYPSIYRIVYPVVQRVASENNFPVLNDETVTSATNTVYNIVEGDLNSAQNSTQNTTAQSDSNNSTSSMSNNYGASNTSSQIPNKDSSKASTNLLLKDLIRILVIRELIGKSNVRRFPYNLPQYYYVNNNVMTPYYI